MIVSTGVIVKVRGLEVALGGTRVLDGVELTVVPGEVVAVAGQNGVGKSTLLRCLAGLEPPGSGTVGVLDGPSDDAAFWRDVALVAEEPAWYPGLTVAEHLELMHAVHREGRLTVDAALSLFDLAERRDRVPMTLSTGQRQRLTLAMALIRPSRLLLLDEPERGLDTAFKELLASVLAGYAADGGAVVMATHDLEFARAAGARVTTMEAA